MFRALHQAHDVLPVLHNDHPAAGKDGRAGCVAIPARRQPQGEEGKDHRRQNRSQGYITGQGHDDEPKRQGGERRQRAQRQENAKRGGHALATFEAEPDGKHVAQNHEQSGQDGQVAQGCGGLIAGQKICHCHCGITFAAIEEKGQNTQSLRA